VSTIFPGYSAKPEKGAPIARDAWKPIEAGEARCDFAQVAVIVAGEDVGRDLDVCADVACKRHWSAQARAEEAKSGKGGNVAPTAEEKAAAKKAREDEKVKKAAQVIAVAAVVRDVGEVAADDGDLRMIARALWRAFWRDVKVAWAGWRDADGDPDEAFKDAIKAAGTELEALLVELALAQEVAHGIDPTTETDELKLAAKRHGVDAKRVIQDAKDATEEPKPAPAAKPAKKKATKAKPAKAGTKRGRKA
jgi:hypothetical protein